MANKKYKDKDKSFKWKHAVGEIILWLVTWYCRYAFSYRDLKEIAEERGFTLNASTTYRWVMETMRMIQKGQVRYIDKNVVQQNQFVRGLFGLTAYLHTSSDKCFLREMIFLQQCHSFYPK